MVNGDQHLELCSAALLHITSKQVASAVFFRGIPPGIARALPSPHRYTKQDKRPLAKMHDCHTLTASVCTLVLVTSARRHKVLQFDLHWRDKHLFTQTEVSYFYIRLQMIVASPPRCPWPVAHEIVTVERTICADFTVPQQQPRTAFQPWSDEVLVLSSLRRP